MQKKNGLLGCVVLYGILYLHPNQTETGDYQPSGEMGEWLKPAVC